MKLSYKKVILREKKEELRKDILSEINNKSFNINEMITNDSDVKLFDLALTNDVVEPYFNCQISQFEAFYTRKYEIFAKELTLVNHRNRVLLQPSNKIYTESLIGVTNSKEVEVGSDVNTDIDGKVTVSYKLPDFDIESAHVLLKKIEKKDNETGVPFTEVYKFVIYLPKGEFKFI
jgi:hypothetical protein